MTAAISGVRPRFNLGKLLMTQGVSSLIDRIGWLPILHLVGRHLAEDWSGMSEEDRLMNQEAVTSEGRVFSSFAVDKSKYSGEDKIWIITEADRSCTTVLLPDEY